MKTITVIIAAVMLTGCATVKDWIPSFWDDNQSQAIVDVRLQVDRFDCDREHLPQVAAIRDRLRWFELYSESKGWRQQDVRRITKPMQETVEDFYQRSQKQQGSAAYCRSKQMIMRQQSSRAAEAILGRF